MKVIKLHLFVITDKDSCVRYTLDEYGTARRTAVVRCFIDALTRGGMYIVEWSLISP